VKHEHDDGIRKHRFTIRRNVRATSERISGIEADSKGARVTPGEEGWTEGVVTYMYRSWWQEAVGAVVYILSTTKCTIRQSACRSKVWALQKSH